MTEPLLLHHLTLNPLLWLLCLLICMSITSAIAYKFYKSTSLFWKKVDFAWILLASFGAIIIVVENNKLITANFLKSAEASYDFMLVKLSTTNSKNEIFCINKIYSKEVCSYLDELYNPLKKVVAQNNLILLNELIKPYTASSKLSHVDIDKMNEIYDRTKYMVKDYNERLDIVMQWKQLNESAKIDIPFISYIGSMLFIIAFSLRIGKSVADIRAEQEKINNTQTTALDEVTSESSQSPSNESSL